MPAAWRRILSRLQSIGIRREATECASAFSARAIGLRPDLAPQLSPLAAQYLRLRYGRAPAAAEIHEFARAARRFTP